ncbi:hypothetical protein F4604DRAFT_1973357 [Suillus subluteus]|nr:hypothetical protein F4604DRAFT_1973357 [Suillus subluteus]
MILEMLMISDLHAIGGTCHALRDLASEVIRRRFRRLLEPFAGPHFSHFLESLKHSGAIIAGSASRAMVSGNEQGVSRDLNIIVLYVSFHALHSFIKHTMGYVTISQAPHPVISPVVSQFRKYASNQRIITLSGALRCQSILQIILNAPTTADMVFMTTGGVCWFYPQWLQQGLAIRTCNGDFSQAFISWAGRAASCVLRFGTTLKSELSINPWFGTLRTLLIMFSTMSTWNGGCHQIVSMHVVLIRFLQLIKGIFYGSACHRPFLVPIPVRDGVDRPPTLDDLDVTYWVKQHGFTHCTASHRVLRRSFNTLPQSDQILAGRYTMYFEIATPSSPQNRLLTRMLSMSGCHETVVGSVLIMKERPDFPHPIVDMTKEDQLFANFLLSSIPSGNQP